MFVIFASRRGIPLLPPRFLVSTAKRRVGDVAIPVEDLALLAPQEDCWVAFRRMAERNVNQLPVVENGRLLGAVTRERLLAMVQAQLSLGSQTSGS